MGLYWKHTNMDYFMNFYAFFGHSFVNFDTIMNFIKRLEAVKAKCNHGSKTYFLIQCNVYLCIFVLPFGLGATFFREM